MARTPDLPSHPGRLRHYAVSLTKFTVVLACLVVSGLCLTYLAFTVSPDVFGFQLAQTRGTSMEPFLSDGDIVLLHTTSAAEAEPGDVILFDSDGRAVFHRVIETRPGDVSGPVIVTQGDNNPQPDAPLHPSQVSATLVGRLPLGSQLSNLDSAVFTRVRQALTLITIALALWRTQVILRQRRSAT